jgi:dihydrofolate synthase/folylpolyglutamate synthase
MAHTFNSPATTPRLRTALERLDSLVDWERWERSRGSVARMRVSVEPMEDLTRRLGHPERAFRHVHVAGTKGKGSVASLVAEGLRRAGLRTGVYASPHVERVNERIVVDGDPLDDDALAAAMEQALVAREAAVAAGTAAADATWFDVLTAAAFVAFRAAGVAWAVVECGLGGRLDSTNVLPAGPCVITNIDLEHTVILGDTRGAIAREKAGIVKPGGLLVHGVGPEGDEAADVVRSIAAEHGVPCRRVEFPPGEGIAARNVLLAGALLDQLGRTAEPVRAQDGRPVGAWLLDEDARARAALPGRLERRVTGGIPIVLDGAHVPSSLGDVLAELRTDPGLGDAPVVIFGTGREKDAGRLLKVLVGEADRVLCTTAGQGPYRSPGELLEAALRVGLTAEAHDVPDAALARARELAAGGGWILVTGSLHLVGVVRTLLRDPPAPCSPSSPT